MVHKLQLDNEKDYLDRTVISKILNPDQSSLYGYLMTKPLPTGCIKQQEKLPSWKKFNLLLNTVDFYDQISPLFLVETEYIAAEADSRTIRGNRVYTPIFEKKSYRFS